MFCSTLRALAVLNYHSHVTDLPQNVLTSHSKCIVGPHCLSFCVPVVCHFTRLSVGSLKVLNRLNSVLECGIKCVGEFLVDLAHDKSCKGYCCHQSRISAEDSLRCALKLILNRVHRAHVAEFVKILFANNSLFRSVKQ